MGKKLEELFTELQAEAKGVKDLNEKAKAEDDRDFTDEEQKAVDAHLAKMADIEKDITKAKGRANLDEKVGAVEDMIAATHDPKAESKGTPNSIDDLVQALQGKGTERKSLGQAVVESPEFAAWHKSLLGGRSSVPQGARVESPPIEVKATLIDTGVPGTRGPVGGEMVPQQFGLRDMGGFFRPLTLRDIISVLPISTDVAQYVKVIGFTNAADIVAKGSALTGTTGTKPFSDLELEPATAVVKDVAHLMGVHRNALADLNYLRALIDQFLRYGLEEKEEDIINDGDGGDYDGLANDADIQDQPWATDLLTTARKARTLVRTVGRVTPNAYLLHPLDWERFDLLTNDTQGNFYFGGPREMMAPRLWGLPVVESEGVDSGVGYVGDFRQVAIFEREGVVINATDSHSDWFARNLVAIRAEKREAFGIFRPQGIVRMDLTA